MVTIAASNPEVGGRQTVATLELFVYFIVERHR